ncbi:MAG: 16S rRNA (adenine(1518)-N(6)/adenine(1519)-N(6))-dimethyltransferase RsmA [Maricaulis sp.]|jgi:16S rRNA (adenine1518-N6/adenine1519-N6)-dimethyltransferase|nr:16S rRNA (adenine(1518)-N(6)/adenine(1519)-N(6))-dimethyltransferase RsmA [Maricaulis sp.]MDG2044289.1 16S rRNA (adenine(1518)-N(6)/adenine(1519)-N(6))-dimethyltransferase RsmA [Maricaulis sp.]
MADNQLPPLRDVIARHELAAKKAFGQHFLLDLNLTAKIASFAGDMSRASVLEVGPGPGGLTRAILAAGAQHLTLVEKDARFIPALEELHTAYPDQLTITENDALRTDDAALLGPGERVILSNLPYNVGTQILIKWIQADPIWWRCAVLMFQREVAERIVAKVNTKAYGRLAVLSQSRCQCQLTLRVPAAAFTPPPKVESAIVVLEPLPPEACFDDIKALEIITASAFGQRRKTLRRSLGQAANHTNISSEELIERAGLDSKARAETIDIEGFQTLANVWRQARNQSSK